MTVPGNKRPSGVRDSDDIDDVFEEEDALEQEDVERGLGRRLDEVLESALPGADEKQLRRVRSVVLQQVVSHQSSPFMPPEMAKEWEGLVPGSAERFLAMVEENARHRRWWERRTLQHGAAFQYLGILFAFVVSMALIGAAVYCVVINQIVAAGLFLAASAVGMVRAFLEVRREQGGGGGTS